MTWYSLPSGSEYSPGRRLSSSAATTSNRTRLRAAFGWERAGCRRACGAVRDRRCDRGRRTVGARRGRRRPLLVSPERVRCRTRAADPRISRWRRDRDNRRRVAQARSHLHPCPCVLLRAFGRDSPSRRAVNRSRSRQARRASGPASHGAIHPAGCGTTLRRPHLVDPASSSWSLSQRNASGSDARRGRSCASKRTETSRELIRLCIIPSEVPSIRP